MLPALTVSPAYTFTPRYCGLESRPLREEPCPFLCAMTPIPETAGAPRGAPGSGSGLAGDGGDLDLGVGLTVATAARPALLLLAEVQHLAVLVLGKDLAHDLRARHGRLPNLRAVGPTEQQDVVEGHLGTDVARDLLDPEHVALGHAVLLAARANDCVHR